MDDEFDIDALGLHATNEERMELVVMRMPQDQREAYRRLSFDSGIMPDDRRWQFLEYITRFGPEAADAMMREIGRVNYHLSESGIDEWQARVRSQVESMGNVLSLDARFDEEAGREDQPTLSPGRVSVIKRAWARLRCFVQSNKQGDLS